MYSLLFGGTFSGASSAKNSRVENLGLTSGSNTTMQTVGVQYSTTVGTQGSTSSSPLPTTGRGLGGVGGFSSSGSSGS